MKTPAGVDHSHKSSSFPKPTESTAKLATPATVIPHLKDSRKNGNLDISRFRIPVTLPTKRPPLENLPKPKRELFGDLPKVQPSSRPLKSSGGLYPYTSPLGSPSDHIKKTMDLPEHKLYSEAVVSQMLSLRIQQEITKQTQEKVELARLVSQLMKNAEANGMGSQLIKRLFLDEDCESHKNQISKLRHRSRSHSPHKTHTPDSCPEFTRSSEGAKLGHSFSQASQDCCTSPLQKGKESLKMAENTTLEDARSGDKRDAQEYITSSLLVPPRPVEGSETSNSTISAESPIIKTPTPTESTVEKSPEKSPERTPERTPEKDPGKTTRTTVSESSMTSRSVSGAATRSSISLSTTVSVANSPPFSRPHMSPTIPPITPPVYPYYYHYASEVCGHPANHLIQSSPGLGIECVENSSSHYTHQYPSNAFSSSSQGSFSAPGKDGQYSHGHYSASGRSERDQKLQPIYQFTRSPPSVLPGQGFIPQRYYAPSLPGGGGPNFYSLGSVPWESAPLVGSPEKRNLAGEDAHVAKKQRGSKNEISFMISTPSNPPARKYNKPPGEK